MEELYHQRPRVAELLFRFDVWPLATTLAQHETSIGSTFCVYKADTSRYPDLGPAVSPPRQLQPHLIIQAHYRKDKGKGASL